MQYSDRQVLPSILLCIVDYDGKLSPWQRQRISRVILELFNYTCVCVFLYIVYVERNGVTPFRQQQCAKTRYFYNIHTLGVMTNDSIYNLKNQI